MSRPFSLQIILSQSLLLLGLCLAFFCSTPLLAQTNTPAPTEQSAVVSTLTDYKLTSREGNDYLVLQFDTLPQYEIIGHLSQQIITIRIKNAVLLNEETKENFRAPLIKNIKFIIIPNQELRIMLRVNNPTVNYEVVSQVLRQNALTLRLYEQDESIVSQTQKNTVLERMEFEQIDNNTDRISLYFSAPATDFRVRQIGLPRFRYEFSFSDKLDPRFVLPKFTSIIFNRIEIFQEDGRNLFYLEGLDTNLSIKQDVLNNPYVISLDVSPSELPEFIGKEEIENFFLDKDYDPFEKETDSLRLKQGFVRAESTFRKGEWTRAANLFRNIHFQVPNSALGIRALFRAADAYSERNKKNPTTEGHFFVVQEYIKALNEAESRNSITSDNERAYFRIARSYEEGQYLDLASQYYKELINKFPESPYQVAANFRIGLLLAQQKKYKESIERLRGLLRANKSSSYTAQALYYMGLSYYHLKEFKQSAEYFDRARNLNPDYIRDNLQFLYTIAETYLNIEQHEKARALYETILDNFPGEPITAYVALRLGDFLRDTGQIEQAISIYELAINPQPEDMAILARMRIANLLEQRLDDESYKEAVQIYEIIIRQHSDSEFASEAILRRGITLSNHKEYEEALFAFDIFRERFPDNKFVQNGTLERLIIANHSGILLDEYEKGNYGAVINDYTKNQRLFDKNRDSIPFVLIAQSYYNSGLFEEAEEAYRLLLRSKEKESYPYMRDAARNAVKAGDYAFAVQLYRDFLDSSNPANPNTYTPIAMKELGELYALQNDIPRALRVLQEALKIYKDSKNPLVFDAHSETWYKLGELYRELGNYGQALNAYEQTINTFKYPFRDQQVSPYIPRSFYNVGAMHLELEQLEEAKAAYQRALSFYPQHDQSPWGRFHIGSIYQRQGNTDQAIKVFDELLASNQGGEDTPLWVLMTQQARDEIENNRNFQKYLSTTDQQENAN